jgi:hypothetical protein
MDEINVGDVVRDTVTGFEGMAVAITKWLHGCMRITVQPQKLHDGKPIEPQTFDAPQIVLVNPRKHTALRSTGGPRPEPQRKPAIR